MKKGRVRTRLHYIAAVVWVALTVSLASWWLVFGLRQTKQIGALSSPEAAHLQQTQHMLVWEGVTFIGLLLVGGVALLISVRREHARQRVIEAFFMAFTHDLKTSLASLQLQAESLHEDLAGAADNPNLQRLMKDALRLRLQLENSLYFADPEGRMLIEPVALARFVADAAADWPELTVEVVGDARALADTRALESVIRNLLQNAVTHGGAHRMTVHVDRAASGRVRLTARDDGRGTTPEALRELGQPFARFGTSSGTGVGLFVSRQLIRRMAGSLTFQSAPGAGFTATLDLPEAR